VRAATVGREGEGEEGRREGEERREDRERDREGEREMPAALGW
jgi:hypothetical protein